MTFILAGLLTVGTVLLFNKKVAPPLTNNKIIFLIPMVEEIAKTGFALLLGSSILLNHVFFGAAEAINDQLGNKKVPYLGWIAFLGHLFFGVSTIYGLKLLGTVYAGIAFGYLPHLLWNFSVNKLENVD